MTTHERTAWSRIAPTVIAVQTTALAIYWYAGSGPARTGFDRAVDDGGLYIAAPLFAALVVVGVMVVLRGAERGAPRYVAMFMTGATLVTFAFAALLDALIFLGPSID